MTSLLEVENLQVDIPIATGDLHAVGNRLHGRERETLGLVGSRCGKSMTALALMNLLPKSAIRKASRLSFRERTSSA
jgi:peptide/nickel transport system ATP-binding protein